MTIGVVVTNITIIGAGFVGITLAGILANTSEDTTVYLVDVNPERLDAVRRGGSFFFEEGLNPLIERAVRRGNLIPTMSYEDSVPSSQIVFSCVPTPDRADGSSNLDYVFASAKRALPLMQRGAVFAQKSTVPPGTGAKIESIMAAYDGLRYVSNPEFLREAKAVTDTLYFDRVVVGGDDPEAVAIVLDFLRKIETNREAVRHISGLSRPDSMGAGDYYAVGRADAELIKVASNAFLSLKISYANVIAMLSDANGADAASVLGVMGVDNRIGPAFLNSGRGFGGGCFPKDIAGLIDASVSSKVDSGLIESVQRVNDRMPGYVIESLRRAVGGDLEGKRVALLGLAFKSGTSDTRKSPAIMLANLLHRAGAVVIAYDPEAGVEAKSEKDLWAPISIISSLADALTGADCILIGTAWPEFRDFGLDEMVRIMNGNVIYDADSCFKHLSSQEIHELHRRGVNYLAVGRASLVAA